MKIYGLAVFSTLAVSACLGRAANDVEAVTAVGNGAAANVGAEVQAGVIGNNSAIADGADEANQNENQNENQNNENENEDEAEEDDVQEGNENQDNQNEAGEDDVLNGNLGGNLDNINIDPNNIQGSIGQNILNLLLSMGICNFNLNSLQGLGLGNQIQLLLQLQQLQQLQSLGLVNSFAVDQLIQREILSRTFNLNIIKRSIDASVKQASRGKKRTTMLKRQCANVGNNGAGQVGQGQVGQDQANQGQANQDQANQGQANQGQANQGQENQDQEKEGEAGAEVEQGNAAEEEKNNAEDENPEGIEVP